MTLGLCIDEIQHTELHDYCDDYGVTLINLND